MSTAPNMPDQAEPVQPEFASAGQALMEEPTQEPMQEQETSAEESAPTEESDIPALPTEEPKGKNAAYRQIADNYVIPISDSALEEWAKAGDEAKFSDYAKEVAKGLFPTFAPQIDMGLKTRILLDPYIQIASQVLGPIMSEPDWTDPKWSVALQGSTDPKTGRPVPMTLHEWELYIKSDSSHGYQYSQQANDHFASVLEHLTKGSA